MVVIMCFIGRLGYCVLVAVIGVLLAVVGSLLVYFDIDEFYLVVGGIMS